MSLRLSEPFLTVYDLHLLGEGRHFIASERLGEHPGRDDGVDGVQFAVVTPSASDASVVENFKGWNGESNPMQRFDNLGVWNYFIPGPRHGSLDRFRLRSSDGTILLDEADPFACAAELRPRSASMVWDL